VGVFVMRDEVFKTLEQTGMAVGGCQLKVSQGGGAKLVAIALPARDNDVRKAF